ncbi:UDP-N-acetylmuramoyl-tripeptide--D-alanyl-D-alanine ligase [Luteococcus peritonei]|uniref:UDP-N-acetylmuramoyl-tripeptide--D-alanyl-D-alanine ligase n=1 Tax=Luteococcus peritonei TaxID=88874 RepID=A0ABW4RQV6_9ACTN
MRSTESAELARLAGGRLEGDGQVLVGPDVVIDARRATPGSLFVAIDGERVDGHDFTGQAAANGAAAVLGSRTTESELPHVVVEDPVAGLSELARSLVAREQQRGMVTLAVTGSSGKTSTKDLLAQLLEAVGPTVSPVGSFNNEIGVPLTACGIDERTAFLVSEMGARGLGHVAWLCSITRPDVAMVLNVGTAHLGEFGSRETIAQAKGEIIEALPAEGWAVLNADDRMVAGMAPRTAGRLAWWTRTDWAGRQGTAPAGELHVSAVDVAPNDLQQYGFTLVVRRDGEEQRFAVQLQQLGSHQVSNALAAFTAALCAGGEPAVLAEALNAATARSPWRMEMTVRPDGLAVLNDAYNANPDSMRAALETFARIARARRAADPDVRTVAVLGDMLELGEGSDELHRALGREAAGHGLELVAVGGEAEQMVAGAREAGGRAVAMDRDQVAQALALSGGDAVLLKASRGIGLEVVAEQLLASDAPQTAPTSGDAQ